MNSFEQGKSYECRSICDHNCKWIFKIIRRTAKSLWIKNTHTGETVRKAITINWEGSEQIFPLGRYSMAPTLTPEKLL